MKKFIITALFIFAFTAGLFAQHANIALKAGVAYPETPESIGFDSALSIEVVINKYFGLGVESGFQWISQDASSGDSPVGDVPLTESMTIDYMSVPVLGYAKVFMQASPSVFPYIAAGAGYQWTGYSDSDNDWGFNGFIYQGMIGCMFNLGADANDMSIVIEAGWRGTKLERDFDSVNKTLELKMSGPFVRFGVSFMVGDGGQLYY